jgi:hypothetical protein
MPLLGLGLMSLLVVLLGAFADPLPTSRECGASLIAFFAGVLLGRTDDLAKHGLASPGEAEGIRFAVMAAPQCELLITAVALLWSSQFERGSCWVVALKPRDRWVRRAVGPRDEGQ